MLIFFSSGDLNISEAKIISKIFNNIEVDMFDISVILPQACLTFLYLFFIYTWYLNKTIPPVYLPISRTAYCRL